MISRKVRRPGEQFLVSGLVAPFSATINSQAETFFVDTVHLTIVSESIYRTSFSSWLFLEVPQSINHNGKGRQQGEEERGKELQRAKENKRGRARKPQAQ